MSATIRHQMATCCALLLAVLVIVLLPEIPATAAVGVPKTGTVEVTGYGRVTLLGSSQPSTVKANGHQATAIRQVLSTLKVLPSRAPVCMENPEAFSITFLASEGTHRPTWVATETDCPAPGIVTISEHGTVAYSLKESCSLRVLILTLLPRGKAEGTRRDQNSCSS
jgi:hypothetical protein